VKRLSRKEVKEALKQIPMEQILIGQGETKETRLTHKELRFAEEIAKGASKAEAYRRSRETRAKPATASRRGQALMKDDAIVAQVEAFRLAMEAERLRTPAQLRALTIQKLTEGALDKSFPPAQRIKCLELLGKITEVALFTERREIIKTVDSSQIREKLIQSLSALAKKGATDVNYKDGESLLAELTKGPEVIEPAEPASHPVATPRGGFDAQDLTTHTNPLIQSSPETHLPSVSKDDELIAEKS
jgi:hypothetical protein